MKVIPASSPPSQSLIFLKHHPRSLHTRPPFTVTLISLLFLLFFLCIFSVSLTTAHAQTYEEDRGSSSSWSDDDYQYDDHDYEQQEQQRNWRRSRPQYDMLPGYEDWDNKPVVTALDNCLSSTTLLFQELFRVLHTLYRRFVLLFTLPYHVIIAPPMALFRLYSNSNNKKSTALVRVSFHDDEFIRLYDTWTGTVGVLSRSQRFQMALYYASAFVAAVTLAVTGVRRMAENADVRDFMRRRGHGFILVGVLAVIIDAGFMLANSVRAFLQLGNAALVLMVYLTVWVAVPAFLCVVVGLLVIMIAWVFRDWTKDKK